MPKTKIKSSKNSNPKQDLTLYFFKSILKFVGSGLKILTSGASGVVQWVRVLAPGPTW